MTKTKKPELAGIKGNKHTSARNMKTWKPSFARVQTPEGVEAVFFSAFRPLFRSSQTWLRQIAAVSRPSNHAPFPLQAMLFRNDLSTQAIRFLTLFAGEQGICASKAISQQLSRSFLPSRSQYLCHHRTSPSKLKRLSGPAGGFPSKAQIMLQLACQLQNT